MSGTAVATVEQPSAAALAEQVVIKGDLSKLTETDRMRYYSAVCESLGLNPLTRPFEYISLNNRLTLYATRAAADQLRATRGITITSLEPKQIGDLYVVVATGRDRTGREDSSTGAVAIANLKGESLANAMMKAETKAKRRLTLSLAGLGWTDETEIDSIPGAQTVEQPKAMTLAERVAQKAAEVSATPTDTAAPGPSVTPVEQEAAAIVAETFPDGGRADDAQASEQPNPESADPPVDDNGEVQTKRERCPAMPPDNGMNMTQQCALFAEHKGYHKSREGSWPG